MLFFQYMSIYPYVHCQVYVLRKLLFLCQDTAPHNKAPVVMVYYEVLCVWRLPHIIFLSTMEQYTMNTELLKVAFSRIRCFKAERTEVVSSLIEISQPQVAAVSPTVKSSIYPSTTTHPATKQTKQVLFEGTFKDHMYRTYSVFSDYVPILMVTKWPTARPRFGFRISI